MHRYVHGFFFGALSLIAAYIWGAVLAGFL